MSNARTWALPCSMQQTAKRHAVRRQHVPGGSHICSLRLAPGEALSGQFAIANCESGIQLNQAKLTLASACTAGRRNYPTINILAAVHR